MLCGGEQGREGQSGGRGGTQGHRAGRSILGNVYQLYVPAEYSFSSLRYLKLYTRNGGAHEGTMGLVKSRRPKMNLKR